jgi:hypothetical protein
MTLFIDSLSNQEILQCLTVQNTTRFSFLGVCAELRKTTISFFTCLSVSQSVSQSVSLHETTQLPLDGFSLNLIFEDFSKICREILSFI